MRRYRVGLVDHMSQVQVNVLERSSHFAGIVEVFISLEKP
jgi:hypothetical protein